ncbi:hypothetical protein [Helicobacter rodentium]|uniref:hypothetical protein n=1 Tax=Helicobacter rodentium TaxID=59617 RepID=UPI0025582390|nr:hypothetical protein [Helicobacter rodentium]
MLLYVTICNFNLEDSMIKKALFGILVGVLPLLASDELSIDSFLKSKSGLEAF